MHEKTLRFDILTPYILIFKLHTFSLPAVHITVGAFPGGAVLSPVIPTFSIALRKHCNRMIALHTHIHTFIHTRMLPSRDCCVLTFYSTLLIRACIEWFSASFAIVGETLERLT